MLPTDKKTKIIATIGPASDSQTMIRKLIRKGVNVFRFNMKHGTIDWHKERIKRVRRIADSLELPIGILIDLQGPEIRLNTKDGEDIKVTKGYELTLSSNSGENIQIPMSVLNLLKKGDRVLIDDGFIEGRVIVKTKSKAVLQILNEGIIKNQKSLNIPGKHLELPSLIKKDIERLKGAADEKIDFVALSFSRSQRDIEILQKELKKRKIDAQTVAKIETQEALDNIDELIDISDAIMIARGDLGVEIPIEKIAYYQKEIIKKCRMAKKPVIVATQMLESMAENPIPTRAEATDVANAVYDGADAVMLSSETAVGQYPVKAVESMTKILKFNERHTQLEKIKPKAQNLAELVVDAAINMLDDQDKPVLDAFLVFTETGHSAKILSRFRPKIPIIAITDRAKTVETLTLYYGVTTFCTKFPDGLFKIPEAILKELIKKGLLKAGQTIVVIHGQHWKIPGLTNAIAIVRI